MSQPRWILGIVGLLGIGLLFQATDGRNATLAQVADDSASAATVESEAETNDQADEVRALLRALIEAYNQADLDALAALLHEDAATIDSEGVKTQGRAEILQDYEAAFAEGPSAQMVGEIEALRFLTPDVASVHGMFELMDENEFLVSAGRYGLLALKHDGQWKLAELRDYSVEIVPSPTNYDKLQDLEWLVGEWTDDSEQLAVTSTVFWAENQNYLVRTYDLELGDQPAISGTQWIGWDPRIGQVRSWVFDSEGGFSEGYWTPAGDSWIVKSQGVLRDGNPTSSTQVVEKLHNDAMKVRSFDRIVGDELLPELVDVMIVRKPPGPAEGFEGSAEPTPEPPTQQADGERSNEHP